MTGSLPRLGRVVAGRSPTPPPVRIVHLGLGAFHRAHAAWFTDRAEDGEAWGIAAFGGRVQGTSPVVDRLAEQEGMYTVVSRGADGDRFEPVGALTAVHHGGDLDAWCTLLAAPSTALVTLTVTEAGYLVGPDGRADLNHPALAADVAALRAGRPTDVTTVGGRLVAGLAARAREGHHPLALAPCDNRPANGEMVRHLVVDLATAVDAGLGRDVAGSFAAVSTVVDRITPQPDPATVDLVSARCGWRDEAPVVTEPFAEWVLAGWFPGGRPAWERPRPLPGTVPAIPAIPAVPTGPAGTGGAVVTVLADPADLAPYESRKLFLLNGAHSLLAYLGSIRGHTTVAAAFADPGVRAVVDAWWAEAGPPTGQDEATRRAYTDALTGRFANPSMEHRLAQIAADGSAKVPIRVLPVVSAARTEGRLPAAGVQIVAAWIAHLRGAGAEVAPVTDPRADALVRAALRPRRHDAVREVLELVAPPSSPDALADDAPLVAAVADRLGELAPDPVG